MTRRRKRRFWPAIAALMVCAIVGYAAYVYIPPMLRGTGCSVENRHGKVRLTTEQAANAATIAAIGMRKGLPRRAVTIALAAAFQESKIRNLSRGDRDSLGIFQQRPSQGWGKKAELLDPVYASSQFYAALVNVPHYTDMPIHEAAQAVQRSADGSAYAQHKTKARILSAALTGRSGPSLHCWYRDGDTTSASDARKLPSMMRQELGPAGLRSVDGGWDIPADRARHGWALALWAVAHARELGIASVAYDGRHWTVEDGHQGWQPAEAPSTRVRIHAN